MNTNSYEECVLKAINLGNDTDTIGAIAGSLAGVLYTKKNIPRKWIEQLNNIDLLDELCKAYKKNELEGKSLTNSNNI